MIKKVTSLPWVGFNDNVILKIYIFTITGILILKNHTIEISWII